jgi:hypothetical protein
MKVLGYIIDLPIDLNVALFCEWIDLPDLTKFDSSMCNKHTRTTFLFNLFADHSFVIQGFDHTILYKGLDLTHVKFHSWVYLRMLKFRKVFLMGPDEIICCSVKAHDLSKINCLEILSLDPDQDVLEAAVMLINSCRCLDRLVLCRVEDTTAIFGRICKSILGRLKELYVHDIPCRPLSVNLAECIAKSCSALTYLNLEDHSNGSDDAVYQFELVLKNNPFLVYLQLINAQIDDSVLSVITLHCLHVKNVWILGGRDITIRAVVALQSARTDTLVDLHVISKIGKGKFLLHSKFQKIRFSHVFPNDERVVRISEPPVISTLIMREVFQQRHPITKLVLNSIGLTSDMLMMMANSTPMLRLLAIDSCGTIFTKEALKLLLEACCESLTHLHLGDCNHFTSEDLIELCAVNGKRLQVLSIAKHICIAPNDISRIISSCFVLEDLYLCECNTAHNWKLYKYMCCADLNSCICTRNVPKMYFNFDRKMFDLIFDQVFVHGVM